MELDSPNTGIVDWQSVALTYGLKYPIAVKSSQRGLPGAQAREKLLGQEHLFCLQRLVMKNIVYGMGEIYRGVFTSAQVKHLQKFIPELNPTDVLRGPSGLCAQTLDSEGNLVDDFVLDGEKGELGSRILHVRNALSPTAGSSLAITEMIADELEKRFQL
uniref:L-2-hydroxyglutarate dehydrogenase n=1 Tax=Cyprinus carpio carpio TaxID=630221 RepID=A0A9J7XPT6_CYPCA